MPKPTARETTEPYLATYLDGQALRSHEQLGDVAGVAVTVALGGKPLTIGASTQLARDVDNLQYGIGIGPCLHALTTGDGLYVPDLAADQRWGTYGPGAAALGAASCLSLAIQNEGLPVGVFKVYSSRVDGLSVEQRDLGQTIALQLTAGMGLAHVLATQAEELDDRTAAMDQRRQIDLAVGVLMERAQSGPEEAFFQLRRRSNDANLKLREAAGQLLASFPRGGRVVHGTAPFRSADARRRSR